MARRGLGSLEGVALLCYLANNYFRSLKDQAAAALLGAYVDDPAAWEDELPGRLDSFTPAQTTQSAA